MMRKHSFPNVWMKKQSPAETKGGRMPAGKSERIFSPTGIALESNFLDIQKLWCVTLVVRCKTGDGTYSSSVSKMNMHAVVPPIHDGVS